MSEADPIRTEDFVADPHLDEDDQLKSAFVRQVFDAVEAGADERVRELVSPLHPADIADLFEQAPSELRRAFAASLAELLEVEGFVVRAPRHMVRFQIGRRPTLVQPALDLYVLDRHLFALLANMPHEVGMLTE